MPAQQDPIAVARHVTTRRRPILVSLVDVAGGGREQALEGVCWEIDAALGESPVWLSRYGMVASVDVEAGVLHLLNPDTGIDKVVRLASPVSAIVSVGEATLLLVTRGDLDAYDLETGAVGPARAWPGVAPSGTRFNDAKLDRFGRLWIGVRRPDGRRGGGRILSWDRGSPPVVRAAGLRGPNGLAWNRAGNRLYLADSRARVILEYALEPATGLLAEGHVFAEWGPRDGRPDGLAIDADDHLWCAAWDGAAIRRYDSEGRLDRTIQVPTMRPTSCAFGGSQLDQLWVTTARAPNHDLVDPGGSLLAIELGPVGIAGPPADA